MMLFFNFTHFINEETEAQRGEVICKPPNCHGQHLKLVFQTKEATILWLRRALDVSSHREGRSWRRATAEPDESWSPGWGPLLPRLKCKLNSSHNNYYHY